MSDSDSPSDSHWGRYGDLRPSQIEAIRDFSPLAYVPWGALEWHSLHAPIGLDSTKAEGICMALAEKVGGVVLPPIPFGVNTIKPYKGFPHSVDTSAELAARIAAELCIQLADEGFKLVILFTGHYPPEHIDALEAGASEARKAYPEGHRFEVWADSQLLDGRYRADHAGATETSFQMHFVPGSVDLDALPDRALSLDGDGIMGEDPRLASPQRGEEQLKVVLRAGVPRLEALLAEVRVEL